jgi:hypothetical protein
VLGCRDVQEVMSGHIGCMERGWSGQFDEGKSQNDDPLPLCVEII